MPDDLKNFVRIWHPRYRFTIATLLVMGAMVSLVIYAENSLLQGLVQALSGSSGNDGNLFCRYFLSIASASRAPLLFLAAIFVMGIIRGWLSTRNYMVSSRMAIEGRNDLEQEILFNLLRRDDSFYSQHSSGEIINRLELDIDRIFNRRDTLVTVCWSVFSITSNLFFFSINDWRLGLVVLSICIIGTIYSQYVSKPVKAADGAFFSTSDTVKTDFEDYLKAVPEIQAGKMYKNVLGRFGGPQARRFKAYMAWVLAYSRVEFSRNAWPVLAFLVSTLIVLSIHGGGSKGLSLIPVLIYALPAIFTDTTTLVTLRIKFQLADNSIQRILEYQSRPDDVPSATPGTAKSSLKDPNVVVAMDKVSFQYSSPGGGKHGGVCEITTEFARGRWTAIIGEAGAGKSTLVNLLLGRLSPQEGAIVCRGGGSSPDEGIGAPSLMPQKPVLLDGTIRENLLFGTDRDEKSLCLTAGEGAALLEDIGLGNVCRLKALDMRPAATESPFSKGDISDLRRKSRQGAEKLGIELAPFEASNIDFRQPAMDALTGGRSDTPRAVSAVLEGDRPEWLERLGRSGFSEEIIGRAGAVIGRTCNLLQNPDYESFLAVSPEQIEYPVWELRRSCLPFFGNPVRSERERAQMVRVSLTSYPSEWGLSQQEANELFISNLRQRFAAENEIIRDVIGGHWKPFDVSEVHPYLDWRTNLLFAGAQTSNQRQRRELDSMLVRLMSEEPWHGFFIEQGLAYPVGRNGSRLSGGQGQLVALGRAVLKRSTLLVLDEPTSALDPASRERVGAFLRRWKDGRAVVTISHDPELVKQADEVQVVSGGRLVGRGTFALLSGSCEAFGRIFRIR